MQTGIVCALAATLAFAVSCADSGSGDDGSGSGTPQSSCGDGTCAASEVNSCAADCGNGGNNQQYVCGDAQCSTSLGESAANCYSDCAAGSGSGSGSGSNTSTTCPSDPLECLLCSLDAQLCVPPLDQATCAACSGLGGLGSGGGGGGFGDLLCEGMAPDGVCNASAGEDNSTCPSDCP